jgi:predicted dehydrogenase
MLKIGIVGFGYWGPNVVRNFVQTKGVDVVSLADSNPEALKKAQDTYHKLKTTTNYKELTMSPELDAIAVATPVFTHYEIVKSALQNGKHVFVEKPFTSSVEEGEELLDLAEKKNLLIMIDHTFLFTGAVKKIKELIDDKALALQKIY